MEEMNFVLRTFYKYNAADCEIIAITVGSKCLSMLEVRVRCPRERFYFGHYFLRADRNTIILFLTTYKKLICHRISFQNCMKLDK